MAIAIEIRNHHLHRAGAPCRHRRTGPKGAVTVVQGYRKGIGTVVDHHKIQISITIQIGQPQPPWPRAGIYTRRRERAVAPVQRHGDVVARQVCRNKVDVTVAVQIAHHDLARAIGHRNRSGRGKATASVPQKHADIVIVVIGEQQIQIAIAVHVGHGIADRITSNCKRAVRAENCHFSTLGSWVRRSCARLWAAKARRSHAV